MFHIVLAKVLKSFDLQPLQYLATMRMAISICEAEDMQEMLRTFRKPGDQGRAVAFSDSQWKLLRSKARERLVEIGATVQIIDIILEKLWYTSFEIFKWIANHVENTGIDCSIAFCWTPRFTIDHEKTAEMLIENDGLDIRKRFKLACFYCLESKICSLWRMMSLSERRYFFARGNFKKSSSQDKIVLYWTYYIQEVPIDFWANKALNYSALYRYSVTNGYLNATKFFLSKLKENLKVRMIENSFRVHLHDIYKPVSVVKDHLAITCFLISQANWDVRLTRCFPTLSWVFRYFLEWPWQKRFMVVVNKLRCHICEYTFGELLEAIFEKEMEGFHDHDYKELFKEFWRKSPEKCKLYASRSSRVGLMILFEFVKKHFGFVFEEQSFALKSKFRNIVLQQNVSENDPDFEQENVEFFKFLVLEQVATKSSLQRFTARFFDHQFKKLDKYFDWPLGELMFLIDGLLGTV